MKRAVLAPICSGLVIPGLGQILNGHIKKGVLLLAAVFVLFLLGTLALYRVVSGAVGHAGGTAAGTAAIVRSIGSQDLSPLLWAAGCFAALWLYSVLDAAIAGAGLDRRDKQEPG